MASGTEYIGSRETARKVTCRGFWTEKAPVATQQDAEEKLFQRPSHKVVPRHQPHPDLSVAKRSIFSPTGRVPPTDTSPPPLSLFLAWGHMGKPSSWSCRSPPPSCTAQLYQVPSDRLRG